LGNSVGNGLLAALSLDGILAMPDRLLLLLLLRLPGLMGEEN
jgi:hypothetical protein